MVRNPLMTNGREHKEVVLTSALVALAVGWGTRGAIWWNTVGISLLLFAVSAINARECVDGGQLIAFLAMVVVGALMMGHGWHLRHPDR